MAVIRVGLLDSGIAPELTARVKASRSFVQSARDANNDTITDTITDTTTDTTTDHIAHATPLSRIIAQQAPAADFVIAKIFDNKPVTTATIVAQGIRWLVEQKVSIINMSFGLREDRAVLREACAQASEAGCFLFGASPAQGAPVYPSAYPGVVRVTGDARCTPGVFSHLDSAQADIGACAYWCKEDQDKRQVGGASFAVPYVAGRFAQLLINGGDREDSWSQFLAECRYQGPEIRT